MRRTQTAGLIGLFVLGLVGCDGSQSVVAPDAEQGVAVVAFDSADCPSVEEMSATIAQEVESECPDDGFRNYGQLHSCRTQAIDQHMKNLPDCYSGSQRLVMKKRVMLAVGLAYVDGPLHQTGTKLDPHVN